MVAFSNLPPHSAIRTSKASVLRSREDRREFLAGSAEYRGSSFSMLVDGMALNNAYVTWECSTEGHSDE